MRKLIYAATIILGSWTLGHYNPANAEPKFPSPASGLIFEDPVEYHNITLVPVRTTENGPFQAYTLLEAGLRTKTLAVRELKGNSSQAQVSEIEVRNTGKNPVFLLGGEMILGGKQDRILQSDVIIRPNKRWTKVKVFCVEQGRWQGRDMKFKGGNSMAHAELRKAAMSGKQSEVWQEVARKNETHGTSNETQTYRRTIQNKKIRKKIAKFRKDLMRKLPKDLKLAGFLFAINGKLRVADVMGNPLLMKDLQEKLLSAYILEALEHQTDPKAPKLGKSKAQQMFNDADDFAPNEESESGRTLNRKKRNKRFIGEETVDKKTGKAVKKTYLFY